MERNRNFRSNSTGQFSAPGRNEDFRKPWGQNFNPQQNPAFNPWIQNNLQNKNLNPWQANENIRSSDGPWANNFNSNQSSWDANETSTNPPNQVWSQNSNKDNSYWRQVSCGESSPWQNNLNRDRKTPYDRPERNSYDRPDRTPYDRSERSNYGLEGNAFDRPDRNIFERPETNSYDRPDRNAYDRPNRNFYDRPDRNAYNRPDRNRPNRPNRGASSEFNNETKQEQSLDLQPDYASLTPLEAKIERLITAVQSQPDNIGQLILLQSNNEIPPVLLNNAANQVKNCVLVIDRNETTGYSKLRINNTVITEGMYSTKKDAKEALYEMGLDILRSKCFSITSKSHYEEVSMDDLSNQKKQEPDNTMDGNSKAVQMMLKMGWGGKGLGNKEQGEQKTVADKIVENISREGLGVGGQTVMQEVDKILADYARSPKTITLGFDSGFTKEERAQIHAIAAKYHLKSKSEGGFNSRRITISKKMSKWVLVRELLSAGLENESYILTIPDEYKEFWTQEE